MALKEAGYDVLALGPTDCGDMAKHLGEMMGFLEGRAVKSQHSQSWPVSNEVFFGDSEISKCKILAVVTGIYRLCL